LTKTFTAVILRDDVVLDAAPTIEAAAFVSAVGYVLGGGSVGEASTIAALSMLTCGGKRSWASNTGPQRLVVSVFYDLGPGAAAVGNMGIVVLTVLVQYVALRIGSQRMYRKRSKQSHKINQQHQQQHIVSHEEIREQLAARLRYPSIAWSVFVFLLPGVLFSAMSLLEPDNKDDLFGAAPFAGRAVFGSVAMVVGLLAAAAVVHSISGTVWPVICTAPTSEVLCVPHLPRWFLTLCGPSWLLPTVMWETKYHKLRWSSLFSSVASTDALWVQPLLQVHGAVFSLVAAIPFPRSVCAVQFVAAMFLMCLPMGLVIHWRLRLLRRTPSNVLSLLSNAIVFGVILCTWIYADGPVSSQSAAAEARDGLGWALTVVSVTKTVLAVISAAAEKIATRHHKKFISARSQSGSGGGGVEVLPLVDLQEMWGGYELVANQAIGCCVLVVVVVVVVVDESSVLMSSRLFGKRCC
jgi:hypothetical protein